MADYTQTTTVADNSLFGGPNATQAAAANAQLGIASPISVQSLSQPAAPIPVPPAPTVDTHAATNASIPTPPPTVESIASAALAPTDAQNQQSGILSRIADLMKSKTSLATLQTNQETQAGVPALAATLKSLTSQILGYNDQAAKLALDASAGGTIDNQAALDAQGLRSQAGQAPLTAAALRKNQIQQANIAGQALTAKAAYYAANNDYTSAKDAADKAAQVQFDATEQQINYQKSLLDALAPQLNADQTKQSAILKANLDDRATQVANQRDDYKSGQGLAITAMKLNPNDPAAQNAAQQALKLDPNDPQYLTKVANLVAKYQQDPIATQKAILDMQNTRADIAYKNAQTAKLSADANGTGLDPAQLIAYAQQYSATGVIPTGLPKGAFGVIADYAKGSPKPAGTIISNATGVAPSTISSGDTTNIGVLYDLSGKLTQLGQYYNQLNTDLNSSGLPKGENLQHFNDLKNEIVDLIARARTGAVINPSEAAQYEAKLPSGPASLFAPSSLNTIKIQDLQNSLSGKLNSVLANHNAAIVGFSKVNVGGQQYTVGQTVTNDKGQTGIINADGSITLLQ